MLTRLSLTAAVLSGVTASLTIAAPAIATGQDTPLVVYAEPQEGVRTERVTYADLNLAERRDEGRLKLRVAGAVKRVCLYDDGRAGLQEAGYYRCSDGAWDDARPQIAQAIDRASQIALTGRSSIPAAAITIRVAAR